MSTTEVSDVLIEIGPPEGEIDRSELHNTSRDLYQLVADAVESSAFADRDLTMTVTDGYGRIVEVFGDHPDREMCMAAEAFLPKRDGRVVTQEVFGETAVETVECPVCGRQYDYIFDMGHDGLWDPERRRYTDEADISPTGDLTEVDEYTSGTNYNVVLEDEAGKEWERVYHLRSLNHDGDVVHSY